MNDVHSSECAVACTAEVIGAKWTAVIVHDLSEGPRRFTATRARVPGIGPRTLSERLAHARAEAIVVRRSYAESPPRVEYELTDKGEALLPIIDAMRSFGHTLACRRAGASTAVPRAAVDNGADSPGHIVLR